jgi:hypothetical protein
MREKCAHPDTECKDYDDPTTACSRVFYNTNKQCQNGWWARNKRWSGSSQRVQSVRGSLGGGAPVVAAARCLACLLHRPRHKTQGCPPLEARSAQRAAEPAQNAHYRWCLSAERRRVRAATQPASPGGECHAGRGCCCTGRVPRPPAVGAASVAGPAMQRGATRRGRAARRGRTPNC